MFTETNMSLTNFIVPFLLFVGYISISSCFSNSKYCEGGKWLKFNNSCYLLEKHPKGRVSYYDAEDYCISLGARLVSIHSEEEQNFLWTAINDRRLYEHNERRWMGLNLLYGNDYQWSDGTAMDYNKVIDEQNKNHDKKCSVFFLSKNGWRPEHCALHHHPICKRSKDVVFPTVTPLPITGNCPPAWIAFGEKCYKYFGKIAADRIDHKQAKNKCRSIGASSDLVSIHRSDEQAFLTQHLFSLGTSAWIGMSLVESDEVGQDLVFGWTDNSRTDFTNWAQGHPPRGTWKYCARLNFEGVAKGEWIADYCQLDKFGYICQQPATFPGLPPPTPEPSDCKTGFVGYRRSCYKFYNTLQTHEQAEKTCNGVGGHLVSIQDGFEQAFLYGFIPSFQTSVWNGLRNIQDTTMLQWTDKQPVYYINFIEDQPKFNSVDGSCAVMERGNDLKWRSTGCSHSFPFVCEINRENLPSVPSVVGSCLKIGTPWIDIGDTNCYHVADTKHRFANWGAASRYCIQKRMKMLTITSDHQSKSLLAYLWKGQYDAWMGLIKSLDDDTYMWMDGSPVNYTNWEKENVFNMDKLECATFSRYNGRWRRSDCNESKLVVCQAPKKV